jgi:hypothetical protein
MTTEQPKQPQSTGQPQKQDEKHPSVLEDKEEFTKDHVPHMGDKPQQGGGQNQKG